MSDARLLYLGNGTKLQSVAMLDDRFESWGLTVDRYWAYSGSFRITWIPMTAFFYRAARTEPMKTFRSFTANTV